MSVIAEFTIPAESFALDRTFETVPDVTIEIERLATHSREWVMPFLWVSADDPESATAELREDRCIDELTVLHEGEDASYANVHWSEDVQSLVDRLVDQHGIMQEAEASDGTWYLKLQFVDRGALEAFQEFFHERGHDFELQRMYDGSAPREREYDLTPEQSHALVAALEMGYFAVPREAQIGDLAEELDVSTNAVSERLRRATANLTGNTLTVSIAKSFDRD